MSRESPRWVVGKSGNWCGWGEVGLQQVAVGSPEHLLLPYPSVGTHGGHVKSAPK